MQLGSIRSWVFALAVAAIAAIAPDMGRGGRIAAQAAATQPGTASRNGAPPANSTGFAVTVDPQASQSQQGMAPLVFFSGRVMTDEGSSPDGSVAIATVCNGTERIETYTDSKGRFNFQFGASNFGVFQDASIPQESSFSGRTQTPGHSYSIEAALANCDLQARAPGYLSDTVRLSSHDPDVGTIMVHRMGNVEGRTVSVTTMAAPKDAKKAFEQGKNDLGRSKPDEARKNFEKAVSLYPDYAAAWQELGKLQYANQQNEQARRSFDAAIKADPKFVEPYLGLAAVQAHDRDWKAVRETTSYTLKLDAYDYPQAYYLNAVANFNLEDVETAEKNAREAEKLDPHGRFPAVRHLLGMILLSRHAYAQAADEMRGFLKLAPDSPSANQVRQQLAQIENSSADRMKDPGN